ncbi:MAG: flagellar hook-length control protein FliK [Pseudomonadales bacterium]|nr:flagellar hook-length control protein FliK [Pseudomonadales bacterium]
MPGDGNSSSAGPAGLPVNKLSPGNHFAEMLDQAQVNFLSFVDSTAFEQSAVQDIPELPDAEQLVDDLLPAKSNEDIELPAAMTVGNVLPERGKHAPLVVSALAGEGINEDLVIDKKLSGEENRDTNQGLDISDIIGLSALQQQSRPVSDPQSAGKSTQPLPTSAVPEAIVRINESLQANVNPTLQVLAETKPVAQVMMSGSAPTESLPSPNTLAQLRSSYSLDRANDSVQNAAKLPGGKTDALPTDLQTPFSKIGITDVKTDLTSGAFSESKDAPGKLNLDQAMTGVVKSADESSAPKSVNQIPPLTLKPLPGSWIQQGEAKAATVDRVQVDPVQTRVESQPVNTASLMQRHVEQHLTAQGSDTKRLQGEVIAALDARFSTESTDRPVATPARFDPSTSLLQKSVATPNPGAPEVSSRQMDTAVQDQILRVMSRQALSQGRLTLQLNPHELGSLDIEFSTEKGEVQVAIMARETSTRDLLEASVARLRQSLQDVGVNVGQLDIRQGERQSSDQGARESMHQSMTAETSGPGAQAEEATTVQRRDDGGIHIYV